MRAAALDVHRHFCEVAIVAEGRMRFAGRSRTRPEALEGFAQSRGPDDCVALEVTGNAWAIARILDGHVARALVVSPTDTGIRRARAETDRLDARTLAKPAGELARGGRRSRSSGRGGPCPAGRAPVRSGAGTEAVHEHAESCR